MPADDLYRAALDGCADPLCGGDGGPCPTCGHDVTAPAQTAVSGTTPPGEGDPVGAGGSGPQRAAQAVVDAAIAYVTAPTDAEDLVDGSIYGDLVEAVQAYQRDVRACAEANEDREHAWDRTGYDEQMGWHTARCRCGYIAVSQYSVFSAVLLLNNHLADHAEADRA